LTIPEIFEDHEVQELSDPKKINVKPDGIRLRTTKAAAR
jgi:hypothetical protein